METIALALAILAHPSHAKRGRRFIDRSLRVAPLLIAGGHARGICCSVAHGPGLRPGAQWPCVGLIPIRCGEKWAIWLSVVTLLILLATRTATDPRCLVVLDPHQHGCHTFMISTVLGFVGLALAAPGRSKPGQSQTAA